MCEASPGLRCAADTRAQAAVTLNVYFSNYPEGPQVDPVTSGQSAFSITDTCRDEEIVVPDPQHPDGAPLYRGNASEAAERLAVGTYDARSPYDSARFQLQVHETAPGRVEALGSDITWTGSNYDPDRHPNDTAKLVRAEFRDLAKSGQVPPQFKVRVRRGHGWTDLNVHIDTDDPENYYEPLPDGVVPDDYTVRTTRPEVRELAGRLHARASSYVRTRHDSMTDYHSGAHVFVFGQGGHVLSAGTPRV